MTPKYKYLKRGMQYLQLCIYYIINENKNMYYFEIIQEINEKLR